MRSIGYLLVLLVNVSRAFGADVSAREFSDDEWRADIDQYVKLLNETHINLFHSVSEQEFRGAVNTLLDSVPTLSDYDIVMEIVALGAMIGDGHAWTGFGERYAPAYLPLSLYEEDGVFIIGAHSGNEEHVGKQLIAMANVSVDEMLLRTTRYTSRDNEWGLLRSRVHWLTNEGFLVREKTVVKGEGVTVTLLASYGEQEQVNIGFLSRKESAEEFEMIPVPPDSDLPLYRRRGSEFYWMEYLPKQKALFVKFNVVRDAEEESRLGAFSNEVIEFVEAKKVRKLIIDVRHNGGGNGNLTRRIVRKISTNERINQRGKLFIITGRQTFSAALMFTARMERRTEALFAGEPGAGKPNSYSEFNGFTLSNTQMHGSISSIWHEEGEPDDTREFIPVNISAPLSSQEFFSRQDPVLEAILAY